MIRWTGFFLIVCSGGLWGEFFLARRRKQIRDIQTGIRLVRFLTWELRHHPEQMTELPGRLTAQEEWSGYLGKEIRYLDQLQVPTTLPKGIRRFLKGCFSALGHQEAEISLRQLEQALHWMEEMEAERRQTLARDTRLYRPLGFSGGLALAILLL